jgi:hypothetical protein
MLRFTNSRELAHDLIHLVLSFNLEDIAFPNLFLGRRDPILLALMGLWPSLEESTHQHGPEEDPLQCYASSTCISVLRLVTRGSSMFPTGGK